MILIVGLGNPGPEYASNRHNAGFMVVDSFIQSLGRKSEYVKSNSFIISTDINGKKVFFQKPFTYMNKSGSALKSFLKNLQDGADRILVIYDDMDIEFGQIRLRAKGSAGGHNGLESIIRSLPDIDFDRMRFGIGRPPGRMDPSRYVLSDFNKKELEELDLYLNRSRDVIDDYIENDIYFCMNKYN